MSSVASRQNSDALRLLNIEFSQMAALVETQLGEAISAFERRDVAAAQMVVKNDPRIDAMQHRIDAMVLKTLVEKAPDEQELRGLLGTMKVAAELERIGDLAKNVAKRTQVVSRENPPRAHGGVARMGRASMRQISDILNAYSARNLEAAKAVWGGDDDLDELYNSVFKEIMLAMMEDSRQITAGTHLAFIAKNFERVGDHATNIAEVLHFLVTGSQFGGARPKGDDTSMAIISPKNSNVE